MSKLSTLDIKAALGDPRFREMFPEHADEMDKYLKDPGCACNITLYNKLMNYKDRLKKYFPTKEIETTNEKLTKLSENHWRVINCKRDKLEAELRKLPKGRKQLAVAIDGEEATVIINELDLLF